MYLSEHDMYQQYEAHVADWLRQAQLQRQVRASQATLRPAYRLALTRLGAALIALGARLQAGTEAEQPIQQTANR
jgi:hypothetical protein